MTSQSESDPQDSASVSIKDSSPGKLGLAALERENEALRARVQMLEGQIDTLEHSRRDLDALLSGTRNAVLFLNRDLVVERISVAARKVLALDDSHIGTHLRSVCDVFGAVDLKCILAATEPALAGGASDAEEVRTRAGRRYLNWSSPLLDRERKVRGLVVRFVDIDPLQGAQQAVEQSALRLRNAQRLAAVGDFIWHENSGEMIWSDELYEIFAVPAGESVDLASFGSERSLTSGDQPVLRKWLEPALASGSAELPPHEYRTIRADGRPMDVRLQGAIQRDATGAATVFGAVLDITEHRELQRFNSLVVEASVHGVFVLGLRGQGFTFVNAALTELMGYSAEEAYGWSEEESFKVLDPRDTKAFMNFVGAVAKADDGQIVISSYRLRSKSGQTLWVLARGSVFERDSEGKALSMLGFNIDVTSERELERLNTRILDSASTGIFIVDVQQMRCLYANPRITRMSGFGLETLRSFDKDQILGMVHPDDQALVDDFLLGFRIDRDAHAVTECRVINERGELTWVQISASVFDRGADGAPLTILGFMLDITEQKRLETFNDRIDSSAVTGIFTIDIREIRYTYANEKALEMLGYPQDVLLAMSGEETFRVVHPDDRELVRGLLSEVANAPDSRTFGASYRLLTRAGEPLWVAVRASVFERDSNGAPVSLLCFSLDVSEERRAQGINDRIMASTVTGIVIADMRSQTYRYVNQRMADILGYSVDELMGMKPGALLNLAHPEDRENAQRFAQQLLDAEDGAVCAAEVRYLTRSGDTRWITMHGTVFERDADGAPLSVIGFNLDITDKKIAQLALEQRSEGLEQFAKIAAHDLQEPLRTIKSFVGVLEDSLGDDLDDLSRQSMGFISNASERMSSLITDLLDYSRVGLGELERDVDINGVLEEVLFILAARISETNAVVEVGSLPSVDGRRDDFVRLFLNLITNAIKYRQPDVPPWIRVGCLREGTSLHWSVRDNGIGIDPNHLERIFGVFQRLHLRSEIEGSGIGLAHCRKIVEGFGGRIWCESEPAFGSTFHFVMPVIVPDTAAAGQ